MTSSRRDRLPAPLRTLNALFLLVVVAVMGLPMLNVLAVSLSTRVNSETPGLVLVPVPPTVEGYGFIWAYSDLWRPFLNTVFVSVAGTILHVVLASVCGYVLMQRDLPFRGALTTFVLLTMIIPSELTLVAIYAVNRDLGLINTYTGLILNGAVSGFSALLMRRFFQGIPRSLAEAAFMDGGRELFVFTRIYMRLSVPGIVTIGTLELIRRWNNISMTVTLISSNAEMAAVVITALPLVALYFSAQRFFVTGALVGATKE
jgi:putative aldouronate transport system permease protein